MAAITVNIDDNIYEHAMALFAYRGKTVEEAVNADAVTTDPMEIEVSADNEAA